MDWKMMILPWGACAIFTSEYYRGLELLFSAAIALWLVTTSELQQILTNFINGPLYLSLPFQFCPFRYGRTL